MPTLSVNVTSEQDEEIRGLAFVRKTSKREVGGEAIEAYLAEHRAKMNTGAKLPKGKRA